jgi:translocation and assembly module TamB
VAGRVSGEPVGELGANLAWDGRRLDVHGTFTSPERDSVVLVLQLPLEVAPVAADSAVAIRSVRLFAGDIDVRLSADGFPLRALLPWLRPEAVSALDGTLDADARITGRGEAFRSSGRIALTGGSAALPALGTKFDGVRLDCVLSGNRLEVREARATSGKGELKVEGEMRFRSEFNPELDLAVTANRFTAMSTRDLRAVVSADLKIAGRVGEPRVTGKASVGGSYYYVTPADLAAAQAAPEVRLSPGDVRMMEETFGYIEGPAIDPVLALYDASDLDLKVDLGRDNWVRQRSAPRFAVEVTGDVRLKKAPRQEPELFGRIEPVAGHGYVEQFGRTFDIAGGEILLNGDMNDHTVDLRAEYKTRSSSGSGESDVVVHLGVTGPVDKLRLALTSDPPLSENDILTFIATGRDPTAVQTSSSTSGSGTASLAADYGMSQLTGGLQSAAQEKAGLDVLQIRFDAQQGATLVAGRYVGPTLYLGVRQPLQYHESNTTDSTNPYRTRFEIEYEKYQWLVLNLQGEVDLLRAFLRARYAY